MRALLGAVALVALSGCRPIPQTIGEGVRQICDAHTQRRSDCGSVPQSAVDSESTECEILPCRLMDCSRPATNGENIAKCAGHIETMDCADVVRGNLPPECHDVLK